MTTTRRRNLVMVSPWDHLWSMGGGAGVSDDIHFITGFTRAGWNIHLLMPEGEELQSHGFDHLHVHTFPNFFASMHAFAKPVKRLTWMPLFQAMAVPRALRLARDVSADAVLGLSYYGTCASWACARRLGIPSVAKLFGVMDLVHTEWPAPKYWFKNFEQIAGMSFPQDAWIILDDGTRGDEVARSRGIPDERIHFLPNGIDMEWQSRRIDRTEARDHFDLPRDVPVALFLARLVDSKRPEEAIRAMAGVTPTGACLAVAGEGPARARAEAVVRDLGLGERVHFLGAVPHDDVPRLMAAADVFVSTSNLTNKALPTCEALVCGVPVVAYDVGDTAAVVRSGETGALIRDGDTGALASALSSILSDPAARSRMSEAARRVARNTFTGWSERVAAEVEIFEKLVESHRKRAAE